MFPFVNLVYIEFRKHLFMAKSYLMQLIVDQLFFVIGFLMLTGVFELATNQAYDTEAQLTSLLGFLTWRVAAGCMVDLSGSIVEEAEWGTLEQVWLSKTSPFFILLARSVILVFYYTLRILIMAAVILPILQIPLSWSSGAVFIYLGTLISPIGLALALAGLHLVYKNIESIIFPIATVFLFLTGALTPLQNTTTLYSISRFLPLSSGIDLLRIMIIENKTILSVVLMPDFLFFVVNTIFYLGLGTFVFYWAQKQALIDGSLSHY